MKPPTKAEIRKLDVDLAVATARQPLIQAGDVLRDLLDRVSEGLEYEIDEPELLAARARWEAAKREKP